ncbi:MAG: uracil-DNA glycosylase family protein [Gemmatimonadota bacterium]
MIAAQSLSISPATEAEARYRAVFRRLHAGHAACLDDEWLSRPCVDRTGAALSPVVWSRRNGPWTPVSVLWIGAAPGNAGGRGAGDMGAHGTRIPFGGDIAGANLDLLLDAVGLDRDRTFIAAALNQLPDRGGGEPSAAELSRPVGDYSNSVAVLRDTILASGAALVIALGNVAMRACVAAVAPPGAAGETVLLPSLERLRRAGLERGFATDWPVGDALPGVDPGFLADWRGTWPGPPPRLLWLMHPSAQNMSPHAGADTGFHRRMVQTLRALRGALGRPLPGSLSPARDRVEKTPAPGVYGTLEWRERVGPRHAELIRLWREKGL